MKQRVEEMEREANKLRELQAAAEQANRGGDSAEDSAVPMVTDEDKAAADSRSVYVGNVSTILRVKLQYAHPVGVFDRLTTVLPQRRFRDISKHVAP
jgi:polyadenylate-binding protein 2